MIISMRKKAKLCYGDVVVTKNIVRKTCVDLRESWYLFRVKVIWHLGCLNIHKRECLRWINVDLHKVEWWLSKFRFVVVVLVKTEWFLKHMHNWFNYNCMFLVLNRVKVHRIVDFTRRGITKTSLVLLSCSWSSICLSNVWWKSRNRTNPLNVAKFSVVSSKCFYLSWFFSIFCRPFIFSSNIGRCQK